MKNKKKLLGIGLIVILIAVMALVYGKFSEKPVEGSKSITIEVVNSKEESKVYEVNTDAEYLIDTLKIKEVKGEKIYLTVDVLVYGEVNQSQTRTLTFSVLEEESGWRLSTPTYMAYIPE